MAVAPISPRLRLLLPSSCSSVTTTPPLLQRRRIIAYIWFVVVTLHISIVSNSALNPSYLIIPATQQGRKNMFRTVLSSAISSSKQQLPTKDGLVTTSTTATALELLPLNHEELSVVSSQKPMDDDDDNDDDDGDRTPKSGSATTKSKDQQRNNVRRSPLRTRYGLFRRKLMMMDDDFENVDSDDDTTISSAQITYTKSGTSQQQQSQKSIPFMAGSTGILVDNKYSIGHLFRGGATTTANVAGGGGSSSSHSYGILTIATTIFRTIFVQNFCRFANFVGTTKTRCFCLLVFSVFIESYATTLSKQAKDTGNAFLFARACLVYLFCMVGFNISLAKLDVSVAYAVWSALGTTLVTAVGFFWFGESLDATKILYLGMIVSGVVGLNLRSSGQ